jgi:hypothetical protein
VVLPPLEKGAKGDFDNPGSKTTLVLTVEFDAGAKLEPDVR